MNTKLWKLATPPWKRSPQLTARLAVTPKPAKPAPEAAKRYTRAAADAVAA